MFPVLLSLGANQGDRADNLRAAVYGLGRFLAVHAVSAVYETAPMYRSTQPPFLNLALVVGTDLPPPGLLAAVKALERRLGRVPTVRHGPRPIDIDIVFYDQAVVDSPILRIPHPAMAERGFVLIPAADLVPDWRHPERGDTVAALRTALGPVPDVTRWGDVPGMPGPTLSAVRASGPGFTSTGFTSTGFTSTGFMSTENGDAGRSEPSR